jgi:hypothetical protein
VPLNELPPDVYRAASEVFADDVTAVFDIPTALAARKAAGAPSAVNVRARLAHWRATLA